MFFKNISQSLPARTRNTAKNVISLHPIIQGTLPYYVYISFVFVSHEVITVNLLLPVG